LRVNKTAETLNFKIHFLENKLEKYLSKT